MKNQQLGKKLYSPAESYWILYDMFRIMPSLVRNASKHTVSSDFRERLMLAVTEVNGCVMCSYAHTQMALESGMSISEVETLLAGEFSGVPGEELPAVLFAQHYADSRGKPSKESWEKIKELYGEPNAMAILGSIRMIMMGNMFGIPLGSIRGRITGKTDSIDCRSSVWYETKMLFSMVVFPLLSAIHALFSAVLRRPVVV